MKKITVLLLILTLCISCSKEEEDTLVDSYFSGYAYPFSLTLFGVTSEYDVYYSYRFISNNKVEETSNKNNPYGSIIGDPEICTYTYNYPNITFISADGDKTEGTFIDKDMFRIRKVNYKRQ